jgi:hypothetical protein
MSNWFNPLPGTPAYYTASAGAQKALYSGWKKHPLKLARNIRVKRRRLCYSRPELHYLDTIGAMSPVGVGGSIGSLSTLAEGTEYNTRNGRTVQAKYLQYDILITPPTGAGVYDYYQMNFFIDKAGGAASPAYASVFDVGSGQLGFAFKNLQTNADRFIILKTLKGTVMNGSPDIITRLTGVIKIPYKNSRITYSGAGALIPSTNAVLWSISSYDNTGLAASSFQFAYNIRLAFIDL